MLLHNARRLVPQAAPRPLFARGPGGGLASVRTSGGAHEIRMLPVRARAARWSWSLSFFTLVWTGFALKYPDQWWARPLLVMEGARSMRSLVHRVAAVDLHGGFAHAPDLADRQPASCANTGRRCCPTPTIRARRSRISRTTSDWATASPPGRAHSYVEKAEYWAVVWGAVVMIATGVLLWANNIAMKILPKSWLDVATSVHFYEAVLATLAIVVWHFYSIIFDPDVYPLNTAFLTGVSVKKEEHSGEQRGAHDGRLTQNMTPTIRIARAGAGCPRSCIWQTTGSAWPAW